MSKILTSGNYAILSCGPVQTCFQVDIEIYEDKLGQSGDRILSSHITFVQYFGFIGPFIRSILLIFWPQNAKSRKLTHV